MTTTSRVNYDAVFTRGDLNTDLSITTTDIAAVYDIIAGKQPEQTPANLIYTDPDTGTKYYHTIKSGYLAWIADLNGDSAITTTDIATIYNLIAGGTLSAAEQARQNPALPNDIAYQTTDENTSKNLLIVFPRKLKIFDDTHFSGSTFYEELKKNFKIYSDSNETTEVLNVIDSVSITNNTTGTLTIKLTTLPDVATDYYVKYLSKVNKTDGSHQIAYDSLAYQSFSQDTAYGGSIYEGMLIPDFITGKFSIPKKSDFAAANTLAAGDLVLEGTLTVGEELTVNTDNLTDSDGLTNPGYTYQWSREDSGSFTVIDGEVSNTYTLVTDDVAKKIYVTVTFNDDAGNSETKSTHTHTTISNVTQQDQGPIALTANQFDENIDANTTVATISGDSNNLTFELVAENDYDKFEISGTSLKITESPDYETQSSYTIKIRATNDQGATTDKNFILNVSNKNDPLTGDLTINGTQQQGRQLTVSDANLNDPDGIKSRSYQWYRVADSSATEIDGETNINYTLTAADVDNQVKVVVTITDNLNNTQSKEATTGTITLPANILASGGELDGVQAVGSTLTVDINSISDDNGLVGVTYSYEWKRGDITIAGAVNQTYTLVSQDEASTISVVVTFNDNSGYAETITLTTGIIKAANSAATLTESSSLITGIEKVGEVLSTNIAAIIDNNGLVGVTYSYEWERDGEEISTDSQYTLGEADLNKVIKLTVTFFDDDGYSETLTEETGNINSRYGTAATGEIQLTENNFDNILIRKLKQFTFSNNDFTEGSSVIPKWSAMNDDLIKTAIEDVDGLASDYTIDWNINHGGTIVELTDNSYFDIDGISVDSLTLNASFQDNLANDELLTKNYILEDVITIKTNLQNGGLDDPIIYLAENQDYELTFETEIPNAINTRKNLNTFYDWEFEFTDDANASPTWVGGFYKLLNNDQVNLTDWDNINGKYNSITTDNTADGIKLVIKFTNANSENFLQVRAKSRVLWTPPNNRDGVDSDNDNTIDNYPWQDNTTRSFPSGIDDREWRGGEVISSIITFKRVIGVPESKIVNFEFAGENIVSFRLNDFIFSAEQIETVNNEYTTKYTDLFTLKRDSLNITVSNIQIDNITVGADQSARIKLTIDNSNIAYNSNDVYSVSLTQTYGSYIFCNATDTTDTKSYNISFSTFKNINSTNLGFYSNSIKLGLDTTVNSQISLDGSIIGDNRITSSNDLVGILWKNQNDEGQNRYILYKDRYEEYTSTDTNTPTSTTNFGDYTLDDYIRFRVESNDLKVILSPVFGESNPFKDCYIKYLSFYNNTQSFIKLTTGDKKDRCLITKINSARTDRPKPSNNVYQISTVIGLNEDRSDMASAIATYAFKIENNLIIAALTS